MEVLSKLLALLRNSFVEDHLTNIINTKIAPENLLERKNRMHEPSASLKIVLCTQALGFRRVARQNEVSYICIFRATKHQLPCVEQLLPLFA